MLASPSRAAAKETGLAGPISTGAPPAVTCAVFHVDRGTPTIPIDLSGNCGHATLLEIGSSATLQQQLNGLRGDK